MEIDELFPEMDLWKEFIQQKRLIFILYYLMGLFSGIILVTSLVIIFEIL